MAELNENQEASSSGSDITLSSSDGSSGSNSPREDMFLDMKDASIAHNQPRTGWGWPLAATRSSITDDSINNDESVEKLKSDLVSLSRKAEIADLELQTLRKQIVKETKRGQDLLKDVACLKEERDSCKEECEKLKASQKHKDEFRGRSKSNYEGNPWTLLEEVRQELNHEKNLNVNLQLQLQKTQESNSELILAVQDLEQMLEEGNRSFGNISEKPDEDVEQRKLEELVKQHRDVKGASILEQKIMDLSSEIEMYRRDKDELETQMEQLALDYEILKQENHDMSYKLEQSHLRQQLKLQYECSGSYATIHELENQVDKLESELNDCSNELLDSLATIKELENRSQMLEDELEKQAQGFKAEMEGLASAKLEKEALRLSNEELENRIEMLEIELEKQSRELSCALDTIKELEGQILRLEKEQGFESDLEAVTRAKMEQEQRAIRAEEALRLTRWKNANMAGRLQDEFKRLSMQMQSTFETNEKLAAKAMTEASQLRLINHHLEELLQHAREELQSVKKVYKVQVSDLRKEMDLKSNQMEHMSVEIEEKSSQLDTQRENEDEVCGNLSAELLMLRAEVDRLNSDTASLSAQIEQGEEQGEELRAELEQAKALVKEQELLVQKTERERDNLSAELLMLRAEVDRLNLDTESLSAQIEQGEELRAELDQTKALVKERELLIQKMEKERDNLSAELFMLRAEVDRLDSDTASLSAQIEQGEELRTELEQAKALVKEQELLIQKTEGERDNLSAELLMLRAEVDRLDSDTAALSAQIEQGEELRTELEQVKALVKEQELLIQKTERERDNLECFIDSAKIEAEKSLEELNVARCLKDENDMALKNLQSEMDTVRAHCKELRHSLDKDELEKEKFRQQVFQLKAELNKKDAALTNLERKLKESNARVVAAERAKTSSKNKTEIPFRGSKDASFREKIKLLEGQIKQKEIDMNTTANAFLEKEKDLNSKIKELERKLQELEQSSMVCEDDHRKVDGTAEESEFHANPQNLTENGNEMQMTVNGEEASTINSTDDHKHDIDALFDEMASLREKNSSMETELKEMQERYSEISLKFAEVEGERQQLVMTLRNMKNATKS